MIRIVIYKISTNDFFPQNLSEQDLKQKNQMEIVVRNMSILVIAQFEKYQWAKSVTRSFLHKNKDCTKQF